MTTTRPKIKTRIASGAESLRWMNSSVPKADRDCVELPDGHGDACRLILNRETGEPMLNKNGSQSYCAPWLLAAVFSV